MKKIAVIIFVVLSLASMLLVGCGTSQIPPQLYTTIKKLEVDLSATRPVWRVGDSWTYKVSRNGRTHYYTFNVVDDHAVLDGNACYKLEYIEYKGVPYKEGKESSRHWEFYCKEILAYLGKQKGSEKIKNPRYSPIMLCFPIKVNRKWSHPHFQPGLTKEVAVVYKTMAEEIEGPLGRIFAFKIRREFLIIDEDTIDPNYSELWFAPDYKYFAKMVHHNAIEGWTRIIELINYQSASNKELKGRWLHYIRGGG